MSKIVTVVLVKPLRDAKGPVESFQFREPRFEDYMTLGDPRVAVPSGDPDKVFMRPIPETVRLYVERLAIGADPNVMAGASLRDTLAIQTAVLGFFRDAESPEEKKGETRTDQSTSS